MLPAEWATSILMGAIHQVTHEDQASYELTSAVSISLLRDFST